MVGSRDRARAVSGDCCAVRRYCVRAETESTNGTILSAGFYLKVFCLYNIAYHTQLPELMEDKDALGSAEEDGETVSLFRRRAWFRQF